MSSAQDVRDLNSKLMHARHAYYVLSAPVMSDADYDALERSLRGMVEADPALRRYAPVLDSVGSDLTGSVGTVKHRTPMMSLDNVYTQEQLEKWTAGHPEGTTYTIEAKVDGLSLSCRYADHRLWLAVTRGDHESGEDVTAAAMTIQDIPKTLPAPQLPAVLEIRGEVFVTQSVFERLNQEMQAAGKEPYKNPRNLASGSLKLKDAKEVAKRCLSFMPWQVLGLEPPEGAIVPDVANPNVPMAEKLASRPFLGLEHSQALEYVHTLCGTRQPYLWRTYRKEDLWEAVEKHRLLRDTLWSAGLGMATDGIVIKVEENTIRKVLGLGTKSPRWAVAFKYPAQVATTKLLGVTWQVGRTGRLTPVAELDPVSCSGSTVARANLNNLTYIRTDLGNPKINDMVSIFKGGEIIPQVQSVATRSVNGIAITAPKVCPACGGPIKEETTSSKTKDNISHTCTNVSCPGRMAAHFCYIGKREVMDIEGLGDVLALRFVTEDIAPSLGYLWVWGNEAQALAASDQRGFEASVSEAGFSVVQVNTLMKALEKAKAAPWDKWLQGLGLPGVARETAKAMANFLGLGREDLPNLPDRILSLSPGDFEGLGPITLRDLHEWALQPFVEMDLKLLYDAGVRPLSTVVSSSGSDAPLSGYTICITGEFPEEREKLKAKLQSLGALTKVGVSKKVNLLLVGTAPGQNKLSKAAEYKIRTEGKEWLVQALKSGGLEMVDNGMPGDDDLGEDI